LKINAPPRACGLERMEASTLIEDGAPLGHWVIQAFARVMAFSGAAQPARATRALKSRQFKHFHTQRTPPPHNVLGLHIDACVREGYADDFKPPIRERDVWEGANANDAFQACVRADETRSELGRSSGQITMTLVRCAG